jgi:hypothetical protein
MWPLFFCAYHLRVVDICNDNECEALNLQYGKQQSKSAEY